jgi:hypothetical protein
VLRFPFTADTDLPNGILNDVRSSVNNQSSLYDVEKTVHWTGSAQSDVSPNDVNVELTTESSLNPVTYIEGNKYVL